MDVWDEQLIEYGLRIITSRRKFIEELNDIIIDIHKNLTGKKEVLNLIYEPNTETDIFLMN